MAKLDDIPKKTFFKTPPGYFEQLPAKIQSRIQTAEKPGLSPAFSFALRYALPLVIISAILLLYRTNSPDVEGILGSVDTEDLIEYLHESGVSADEVLETVHFSDAEIERIEDAVYEQSLQDADLTNLDL